MRGTNLSSCLAATATGQIIVLAAVTTGPIGAVIVALSPSWRPAPPLSRWFTYTGLYATQGAAAGSAAQAVAPIGSDGISTIAGQADLAAVSVFAVNFAGNAVVLPGPADRDLAPTFAWWPSAPAAAACSAPPWWRSWPMAT